MNNSYCNIIAACNSYCNIIVVCHSYCNNLSIKNYCIYIPFKMGHNRSTSSVIINIPSSFTILLTMTTSYYILVTTLGTLIMIRLERYLSIWIIIGVPKVVCSIQPKLYYSYTYEFQPISAFPALFEILFGIPNQEFPSVMEGLLAHSKSLASTR